MSLELINTCSSYCMVDLIGTEPSLIKCTYRDIHILYLKLAIDFFSLFLLELILTPLSLCYLSYHQAWLLKWKRNDKFNAQISTKENQYRKKKGSRESDRNWRDRHSDDCLLLPLGLGTGFTWSASDEINLLFNTRFHSYIVQKQVTTCTLLHDTALSKLYSSCYFKVKKLHNVALSKSTPPLSAQVLPCASEAFMLQFNYPCECRIITA